MLLPIGALGSDIGQVNQHLPPGRFPTWYPRSDEMARDPEIHSHLRYAHIAQVYADALEALEYLLISLYKPEFWEEQGLLPPKEHNAIKIRGIISRELSSHNLSLAEDIPRIVRDVISEYIHDCIVVFDGRFFDTIPRLAHQVSIVRDVALSAIPHGEESSVLLKAGMAQITAVQDPGIWGAPYFV